MHPSPRLAAIALAASVLVLPSGAAEPVRLTINADKVVKEVDERIYGHFLEHIYHSCSNGIWGELVWNRSFEEGLPRSGRGGGGGGARGGPAAAPVAEPEPPPGGTRARHWFLAGDATVTVDTDRPFNSEKSLRIVAPPAGGGVSQPGYALRAGDTVTGSLWLRGSAPAGFTVRLVEQGRALAEQVLAAPGAEWREFPVSLRPAAASASATLEISLRGAGTVWLDQVSLMPDSFRATGGFRPDLLQAVTDLHPATIRWPGGSFVGTGTGYNWKTTIGPQSQRVGKVGWDEWDPAAFGIDEFMALCRKVGAEPVIVIYMGPREVTADRSKWIQDAADWVEYCNGPATSRWGAVRAANGHPEPYGVKYWEIDNEIWRTPPDHYVEILRSFVPAMKRVDPTIQTIACGSGGFYRRFADGDVAIIEQAADLVDFLSPHHYEEPDRFAAGLVDMEEYLNRIGGLIAQSRNPNLKIYFSEWNAQSTDWRTGLYAGGVLNTFERHPDVGMACPALFLRHTSAPRWDNAFINFDQETWFPAPNYVVMQLYRSHYAPHLLELTGEAGGLNVVATRSADGERVVLKVVNPTEGAVGADVAVSGAFRPARAALQLVAPDALDARNTLAEPRAVRVTDGTATLADGRVRFELPRWSVAVVELTR